MSDTPELLPLSVAAERVGMTQRGFEALLRRGDGPQVTRLGGRVLVREDMLRLWLDENTAPARAMDNESMDDAPNEATRRHRARITKLRQNAEKAREAKGKIAALRRQQQQAAGGGSTAELRPMGVSDREDEQLRARRAEMGARG